MADSSDAEPELFTSSREDEDSECEGEEPYQYLAEHEDGKEEEHEDDNEEEEQDTFRYEDNAEDKGHLDDGDKLRQEEKSDDEGEEELRYSYHVFDFRELDQEVRECLSGLVSSQFDIRKKAAKAFKDMLKGEEGGHTLQKYVQASPCCTELEEAWKMSIERHGVVSVFSLISKILSHPAGKEDTDDVFLVKETEEQKLKLYVKRRLDKYARTIIRNKMEDIYAQLTSYDKKRQNVALFLLAAIVRRGGSLASDVASSFNFSLKVLPILANPRDKFKRKAVEEDNGNNGDNFLTRRGFIQFALSFLEVSSPSLLRWVLQIKPLYAGLLRGLGRDDEDTIVRVLSVFQGRVLNEKFLVPPGLRSALFGDSVLEQLSCISANVVLKRASSIAHETLMALCTDPLNGLLPECPKEWDYPRASGHSLKGNTSRLLRLLLRLKPIEVDNHKKLLVATLNGRPSLVSAYLDKFPYSVEPRPSSTWFGAVSLLCDLISTSSVSPTLSAYQGENFDVPVLDSFELSCRIKCILPPSFSRGVMNRGLLHSDMLVKHASLRLLLDALRSLDCFLKPISAALKSLSPEDCIWEMPVMNSLDPQSQKDLTEVHFGDGSRLSCSNSVIDSVSTEYEDLSLFKDRVISMKKEAQDKMRSMMPDPQVLLSLLSNLKVIPPESGVSETKRKYVPMTCSDSQPKAKKREVNPDMAEQDIQVFVTGNTTEIGNNVTKDAEAVFMDSDSDAFDVDENSVRVAKIWGIKHNSPESIIYRDEEGVMYAKIFEALALYQRTLPVALIECYFDAFKYLPEDPFLSSSFQLKSLLTLLLECTGGLESCPVSSQSSYCSPGQLYKYLQRIFKLMLYSSDTDIQHYAHILAYRALLSTLAFDRNKAEVELWFSLLPAYSNAQVLSVNNKNQRVLERSGSIGFGSLALPLISFLCDAVTRLGNNLYKYLAELQDLIYTCPSKKDLSPPCFSPLVICVLDNCLRVLSSRNLKLAQKTVISQYVVSVIKSLLECQVGFRALAHIIDMKLNKALHDHCSDSFMCEWSPLHDLLRFAHHILSTRQDFSTFEMITKQHINMKQVAYSQSLAQVLETIRTNDVFKTDGLPVAFTSTIICALPEAILENFPRIIITCYTFLGKDYGILSALFSVHKNLYGWISKVWPDIFFSGLNIASQLILEKQETNPHTNNKSDRDADKCCSRTEAVAFADFLQSEHFFTLFSGCMNYKQSTLLKNSSVIRFLEAKISEIPVCSYVNTLNSIMFWILQMQYFGKSNLHIEEQVESCFLLLKALLMHIMQKFWMGSSEPTNSLDVPLMKEIISTVLFHPAIDMFLSDWVHYSVSKEDQDFHKLSRDQELNDTARFQSFMHLSQQKVHFIDRNILSILLSILEFTNDQKRGKPSQDLKKHKAMWKIVVDSCKPIIFKVFSKSKSQLKHCMNTDPSGMHPCPKFHILSVLSSFVSPVSLIELACSLFSNVECNQLEGIVAAKMVSYTQIGLFLLKLGFEMFFTHMSNSERDSELKELFWDIDSEKINSIKIGNAYLKVMEVSITQPSQMADLCLLSMLKVIHVQKVKVLPDKLFISKMLSVCVNFTPVEYVMHCLANMNPFRAKILLLLTELSDLHMSICVMTYAGLGIPPAELFHLSSLFEISSKSMENIFGLHNQLSEDALLSLIPITLNFLFSDHRAGLLSPQSLKKITSDFFEILSKGFRSWDKYVFSKIFDIVDYDENIWENKENMSCYFANTLLGRSVIMFHIGANIEHMSKKKRRKLVNAIILEQTIKLDQEISDVNNCSFENLLSITNRICAKISLARCILFPKLNILFPNWEGLITHQSEDDSILPLPSTDIANFMDFLLCALSTLFQSSNQFEKLDEGSDIRNLALLNFMERTLLDCLVNVACALQGDFSEPKYVFSFKAFMKSVLLYRFQDCTVLKILRCLCLVLMRSQCHSKFIKQFATDALGFLMAHSHFISTILWTGLMGMHTFDCSDKGTRFKSLTGIVSSLVRQDNGDSTGNIKIQTREYSLQEQRKLEVVKLLRVLYLLKNHPNIQAEVQDTSINIRELFSLLLAGYGATMAKSDVEIFSLMHEIEFFEGSVSLYEMSYLWGEAALKRRREQQDQKLVSEYGVIDNDSKDENDRRQFRDNLIINPKLCADTVLHFPFERKGWDDTIDINLFAEESQKEIAEGQEGKSSVDESAVLFYDPLFILEFSSYTLQAGYLESDEFACLGLLGIAFMCTSCSDDRMRNFAYDVLGKYKNTLENGRNFRGKAQLLLLLTYIKNAVLVQGQKFPSLLSVFAAEASCILMDPTNDIYLPIKRLLMRFPAMDLERIPLFRSMFKSGSVHFKKHQTWMLSMLSAGLNTAEDVPLYRRKLLFELLMSFFGSSLADSAAKLLVLQLMKKAIKNHRFACYLVEKTGLFLWLCSAISKCNRTKSGSFIISRPMELPIVLEIICDLLLQRNIVHWLYENALEQLSQIASKLHWFLLHDSSMFRGKGAFLRHVLQILHTAVRLSNQRKSYQTHFSLSLEGLYRVIEFIIHEDPEMNSEQMGRLGLDLILSGSPIPPNTIEEKVKLIKIGMWAASFILQTDMNTRFFIDTCKENQFRTLLCIEYHESLMAKLMRWLVSCIVLGIVTRISKSEGSEHLLTMNNMENLLSLLKYMKTFACLSEYLMDTENNKRLAQLLLYIYYHVGGSCKVLSSLVAALGMLLLMHELDILDEPDGTSFNKHLSVILITLMSELSCPDEINPSWRWSFNSPWKNISSKVSDKQKLFEDEICRIFLLNFSKILFGVSPNIHYFTCHEYSLQESLHLSGTDILQQISVLKNKFCNSLSIQ